MAPEKLKKIIKAFFKHFLSLGLLEVFIPFSLLLISTLLISLFFLPKSYYQQLQEKILKNPQDLQAYFSLIDYYLDQNQYSIANKSLKKAQNLITSDKTKEDKNQRQERINSLWQKWEQKNPQEISKKITKLEEKTLKYPDYPDLHFQLALYYLQIKENNQAQKILEKIATLAPNYPNLEEINSLIF
ncbi:tetratricopeptide repeat protein [Patescibacteria group bacterium]